MKPLAIIALFLTLTCGAQTISLVSTGLVGNVRPPMNEDGQLAYQTVLSTAGLYLGKPGAPIQFTVATNGPISGSPPYTFSSLIGRAIPNGTNQVAFYESGGGGGLFANLNGTLYRVAVRSNQVAGLPAGVFYMTGSGTTLDYLGAGGYAMNSNGVFVFNSELTGTGVNATNNRVIVKGHPTNLTVVARAGMAAPGFPANYVFERGDGSGGGMSGQVFINNSNRAVFIASAVSTTNPNVWTNCIWFHDSQGLRPVVVFDSRFPPQIGTPAPDAGTSARFNQLWYIKCHVNDAGEVAFYALAMTPSFTGATGIWSGPTNDLHLVIAHNMAAPGITGGATISDLDFNRFYLGNTGAVAVIANLTGGDVVTSNNTALYIGSRTNNLKLIARKGMQAPGCPPGVYFSSLNNSDVSDPVLFGNNRVAFGGKLTGPGLTGSDLGLWATDTNGVLQLVFRAGETSFEVQPGVFRTINTFFYNSGAGQNGRPASINRKGQLAMDITMNGSPDLSGYYILDLNGAGSGSTSGTSSFGSWQYVVGNGLQLNLNVQNGKSYRLQRTLSLSPTNWVTLTNFTSAGTSFQYLDNSVGSAQSIYRVISP
jgi:hypothetical protein